MECEKRAVLRALAVFLLGAVMRVVGCLAIEFIGVALSLKIIHLCLLEPSGESFLLI
jgi:hypothetical protein